MSASTPPTGDGAEVVSARAQPTSSALPADLSPQQLRDVLAAHPELVVDVASHPAVDPPLREWIWATGSDDVRIAIYDRYLAERQVLLADAGSLPDVVLSFDAALASLAAADLSSNPSPGVEPSFGHAESAAAASAEASAGSGARDPAAASSWADVRVSPAPAGPIALELPGGEVHSVVSGRVVIGRNPDAARFPGAQLVAIPDDARRLSASHAVVEWSGTGWTLTDLGSTNGTRLGSDARAARVEPGTVHPLPTVFAVAGQLVSVRSAA